ncbi:MAG: redoxin domain-containing protein [Pseudobacter sp.]|uniref:redoxin domain-containing protein n=1 Tax=Pseudobacter sp. TaxID=2045420 RepID=UPI003F7E9C76
MMTINKLARNILCGLFSLYTCLSVNAQFSNVESSASVKMNTGIQTRYTYDPEHTRLRDADSVAVALIFSTGNGYGALDLKAVRNGKNWETVFILPDSAIAVALRFRDGAIIDDNRGKGYIYPVYQRQNPIAGSRAAAAELMIKCKRVLGLGTSYAQQALELYEKEFHDNPSLKAAKELEYYTALVYAKKRDVYPLVERKKDSLLKKGFSEKDWALAAGLLSLTGKRAEADSLKDEIAKRTKSVSNKGDRFWQRFLSLESADSMLIVFHQQQALQSAPDKKDLGFIAAVTISEFAKQGKPDKAWTLLALLKDSDQKAGAYHNVAKAFIDAGKRLSDADSLLRIVVNEPLPASEKGSYLPPADRKEMYFVNQAEYYNTYARLKDLQGKIEEAVELQQRAVTCVNGANTSFNETLIGYLKKAGQHAQLVKQASGFIAAGTGGASVIKSLKESYADQTSFPVYLDSLQTIARNRIHRQLEFDMIKRAVPAFTLRKTDSSIVTLESLKGKVVVLDFWATWCVPCKRSFPAMQQAVDQYRNDTNVVFLFVDTWETLPPAKRIPEIRKFIDGNGYTFQVLVDEPLGTNSRAYKLATALGVEGIPAKFVIDRYGDIRFMSVGFTGDALKMVSELSAMISIAMKQ